jgi:hypothetical protein
MNNFKENIKNKLKSNAEVLAEQTRQATKFDDKNLLNNIPLLLFIAFLGVVYVANNHYLENKARKINNLESEIKELRWNYMTTKSNLMLKSKQSEVAEMVKELGLKELTVPPYKIEVKKNEY